MLAPNLARRRNQHRAFVPAINRMSAGSVRLQKTVNFSRETSSTDHAVRQSNPPELSPWVPAGDPHHEFRSHAGRAGLIYTPADGTSVDPLAL
jgi:hypothetical protein